jgi:hypothetical protein
MIYVFFPNTRTSMLETTRLLRWLSYGRLIEKLTHLLVHYISIEECNLASNNNKAF